MHREVKLTGWVAAALVAAVFAAPSAHADMVYNYVGKTLNYIGPNPDAAGMYGDHVVAQLTIADGVIPSDFTGTLNGSQFTVQIGGTHPNFAPQAGGDFVPFPGSSALIPAFVTFSQGGIVDWALGTTFNEFANMFTFALNGQGERIQPGPRVVNFNTGTTSQAGTWSLEATPAPVPLPGAAWLLVSGLGALAAARAKRRSAA